MKKSAVQKIEAQEPRIQDLILETLPWTSTSFGEQVEIESFCRKSNQWLTIATVNSVNGVDAEDLAAFIAERMNAVSNERC
jgi:hypothetical protein